MYCQVNWEVAEVSELLLLLEAVLRCSLLIHVHVHTQQRDSGNEHVNDIDCSLLVRLNVHLISACGSVILNGMYLY